MLLKKNSFLWKFITAVLLSSSLMMASIPVCIAEDDEQPAPNIFTALFDLVRGVLSIVTGVAIIVGVIKIIKTLLAPNDPHDPAKAILSNYTDIKGQAVDFGTKTSADAQEAFSGDEWENITKSYAQPDKYGDEATNNADTIFKSDVIQANSNQGKASKAFIKNATGANIGMNKPNSDWKPTPEVLKYSAVHTTSSSQVSTAVSGLSSSLGSRIGQSNISLVKGLHGMTVSKSESFVLGPIGEGIVDLVRSIILLIFALPHIIISIITLITNIATTLPVIVAQATTFLSMSFGKQYQHQAGASQPGALCDKKTHQ